jgi:hypothetical protein
MRWWPFKRRPSFAEAYAQATADIEREYPIEKMRADSQARADAAWAAREEVRKRLDRDGEYQRGEPGLQ